MRCEVGCEEGCLEVDSVLLLVLVQNVAVFDVAQSEPSSHTNYRVVFCLSLAGSSQQISNLNFHGLVRVDDDVSTGIRVGNDVHGCGGPASCLEAVHHCFSQSSISPDD